ncbi:MAG: hypothetical protein V4557_16860 [Bacteroidota bacterium]
MKNTNRNIILTLSSLLTALMIVVSVVAMCTENFYHFESANWQVQSMGQDMINLFLIVPCLLVTAFLFRRGSKNAGLVLCGTLLYIAYTFTIYCFDIHFNRLFLLYCMCLGLSLYSTGYVIYIQCYVNISPIALPQKSVLRIIGIYFIFIATSFYFLWLSEIIPATIHGRLPKSLLETGLVTNGVHVIDLSFFLPGIFIAGIVLLRKKPIGLVFAPVLLSFFILMDITIGFLSLLMSMRNLQDDITVAIAMAFLAMLSIALLTGFFKIFQHKAQRNDDPSGT